MAVSSLDREGERCVSWVERNNDRKGGNGVSPVGGTPWLVVAKPAWTAALVVVATGGRERAAWVWGFEGAILAAAEGREEKGCWDGGMHVWR